MIVGGGALGVESEGGGVFGVEGGGTEEGGSEVAFGCAIGGWVEDGGGGDEDGGVAIDDGGGESEEAIFVMIKRLRASSFTVEFK